MLLVAEAPRQVYDLAAMFRAKAADGQPPTLLLGRQAKKVDIRVPAVREPAEMTEEEKSATMNVSRVHARLVECDAAGGARIEDNKSMNGIFVNGLKVHSAVLRAGDRVVIGFGANVQVGGRLSATPLAPLCFRCTDEAAEQAGEQADGRPPLVALSQSSEPRPAEERGQQGAAKRELAERDSLAPDAKRPRAEKQDLTTPIEGAAEEHKSAEEQQDAAANPKAKPKPSGQSRLLRELAFSSPGPATLAAGLTRAAPRRGSPSPAAEPEPAAAAPAKPAAASAEPAAAAEAPSAEWADADVTEELKCAICRYLLVEPHSLLCSHSFCGPCLHGWLVSCRNQALAKAAKRKRRTPLRNIELPCPECRATIRGKPILVRSLRAAVDAVSAAQPQASAECTDRAERRAEWAALRKINPVPLKLDEAPKPDTRAGRAAAAQAAKAAEGPFDPFDAFVFGDGEELPEPAAARGRDQLDEEASEEQEGEDEAEERRPQAGEEGASKRRKPKAKAKDASTEQQQPSLHKFFQSRQSQPTGGAPEAAAPAGQAQSGQHRSSTADWACARCTLRNAAASESCVACGCSAGTALSAECGQAGSMINPTGGDGSEESGSESESDDEMAQALALSRGTASGGAQERASGTEDQATEEQSGPSCADGGGGR